MAGACPHPKYSDLFGVITGEPWQDRSFGFLFVLLAGLNG